MFEIGSSIDYDYSNDENIQYTLNKEEDIEFYIDHVIDNSLSEDVDENYIRTRLFDNYLISNEENAVKIYRKMTFYGIYFRDQKGTKQTLTDLKDAKINDQKVESKPLFEFKTFKTCFLKNLGNQFHIK